MYAHLIIFTLGPAMRFVAEMVADQYHEKVAEQDGFQGIRFLIDDESGEYGAISFWNSRKAAENANESIYPSLRLTLSDSVKAAPDIRIFEVYQPDGYQSASDQTGTMNSL